MEPLNPDHLMDLEQLWQSTLGEMEVQLSRANFTMWMKNSNLVDKKDGFFMSPSQTTLRRNGSRGNIKKIF